MKPEDVEVKDRMRLVTTQQGAAASILTATVRTNEEMLRRRENDRMAELFRAIEEERAKGR